MIVSSNEAKDFVSSVLEISDNNPFACRIISLYNSYSPELAFVDYWMIADEDSEACVGAIARSGTDFIVFLTDDCNIEEVSSFMRVAGASSVICDGKYELDMYGSKSASGSVLQRKDGFELSECSLNVIEPEIKEAYELIVKCADENFKPPLFEDFYVDVNHKLRHNTMRMYGIKENDTLVAVAMTVAESGNGAVLGAVSCDPEYRKQGYGSNIVKYISNRLINENKTVYLHRAKNANVSFYNNLGFKETGKWREYYFER